MVHLWQHKEFLYSTADDEWVQKLFEEDCKKQKNVYDKCLVENRNIDRRERNRTCAKWWNWYNECMENNRETFDSTQGGVIFQNLTPPRGEGGKIRQRTW